MTTRRLQQWSTPAVRLIRETRATAVTAVMAPGIESSLSGMPAQASAGVVDREGECDGRDMTVELLSRVLRQAGVSRQEWEGV